MSRTTIPVANYKAVAPNFKTTQFRAAENVGLAKAVEMRYIVITSKHQDGIAIFDSKADPFNIVQATPFQRDPLNKLAAECRAQGSGWVLLLAGPGLDNTGGVAYRTDDHNHPVPRGPCAGWQPCAAPRN